MLYTPTLIFIIEVLLVTVPVLLTVAFVTVAERKTMASMQRRLGPNAVGYYGLLQAFFRFSILNFTFIVYNIPSNIIFAFVTLSEKRIRNIYLFLSFFIITLLSLL